MFGLGQQLYPSSTAKEPWPLEWAAEGSGLCILFFLAVLGLESSALPMLGKWLATELHPQVSGPGW
jgi:hypothetical protein